VKPPSWLHRNRVSLVLAGAVLLLLAALAVDTDSDEAAVDPPTTTAVTTTEYEPPATTTTVYRTTTTVDEDVFDADVQDLALDMAWDDTSLSDREDICMGVTLFGLDEAADLMNEGADYSFDHDLIVSKLTGWCY
jgi:hypothetical protein